MDSSLVLTEVREYLHSVVLYTATLHANTIPEAMQGSSGRLLAFESYLGRAPFVGGQLGFGEQQASSLGSIVTRMAMTVPEGLNVRGYRVLLSQRK